MARRRTVVGVLALWEGGTMTDYEGFPCPRCDVIVPMDALVQGLCPNCGQIIDPNE